MKLTVYIQKWLRKENARAVKMKITDFPIDKGKERGQIQFINYEVVTKIVARNHASPPLGPSRVTAWEDTGMTRFAFLHKADNISSSCCAVLHDLHGRWLNLPSERAKWGTDMLEDLAEAARGRPRVKPVRTPVAILGSLGVCIYVPASRHWLISYSLIHLT